jgi:hypothetical protein
MKVDTIDHPTLARLVEAGKVHRAHVVGQRGGWTLLVRHGAAARALAAQRSRKARLFRRMETLVSYLKEIGIQRFEVDAAEYEVEGGRSGSRPDRAQALRRAHEAAAHDRWFRQQVELGLREADDPDTVWVSNDDAKSEWAKKRANLAALSAARDRA